MKVDSYYVAITIAVSFLGVAFFVIPALIPKNKPKIEVIDSKFKVAKQRQLKKVKCVCDKGVFTYEPDDDLVKLGFAKAGEKGPCGYCHGEGFLYEEEAR